MMSVEQFLAVLKEKDLVPGDLLHSLYNQAAHHVTAAEIAQVLIDKGYLTPALANRLMGVEIEQPTQDAGGYERDPRSEQDIGFAPVKEEKEPRPVIGRHRPYKAGDSAKSSASASSAPKGPKPPEPTPPPKPSLLDKPPPSPWATSVYDREIDTSKGIVSPRLVKLAGIEQIPTTFLKPRRKQWLTMLIRGGIILGLSVIFYLLIRMLFFPSL
ncbi:MAG: hypothetical protein ABSA16_05675 [Thermoguttaceae bacterium]